jgi:hypothetical protein
MFIRCIPIVGTICLLVPASRGQEPKFEQGMDVVAKSPDCSQWRTFVPSEPRSHDGGHLWIGLRRDGGAYPRAERGNEIFRDARRADFRG